MFTILKRWLSEANGFDHLHENMFADEYKNPETQRRIWEDYLRKHTVKVTPLTDPLNFDPLAPPPGWRYDPYYELWIEL